MDIEFVRSRFIKHFDGKTGNVYASPGRINLIGEHTDYNGGFVFPGAVDKGVVIISRYGELLCLWFERYLRRQQGFAVGYGTGRSGYRAQLLWC